MQTYQYAGLPDVQKPGLSVDECASRLRHLSYAEERLMFLQAAHIVTVPNWDIKMVLGRLQYEDSQHADQLKARLTELRVSRARAYGTIEGPLATVFDEAMHAANTIERVASLVRVFKPALIAAYQTYLSETNHLADYPTVRALKAILAEETEALDLLRQVYAALVTTPDAQAHADAWVNTLDTMLSAAGGIDGSGPTEDVSPQRAAEPYVMPRRIARDDLFPQVWDFHHVDNAQVAERLAQMVSTRLSEITAAEGLAYVLCETSAQPWQFYVDISRHLWDEVRHALFGEAATEDIFADRTAMPIRVFDEAYVVSLSPLEQYATLGVGIEGAAMKYPPGKREEYEFCRDKAHYPLMTTFQDFDWADEVLHVNIARRQLKDWFAGSRDELVRLAQQGVDHRNSVRAQKPSESLPDLSDKLPRLQV